MVKKKDTQVIISEEESAQARQLLAQYHQISRRLHESKNEDEITKALADITAVAEGAQMALLRELSKEKHTDAADILTALYEVSPLKNVRKEARRSLIRLEGMKIYPNWKSPVQRGLAIGNIEPVGTPSRFWKGFMTDSLNIGEIQMLLAWELEENDKDIRVLGFLLEFGFEGVKDFYMRTESKRSFERYRTRMEEELLDVGLKDCSLAEGRRLLLKALDINKKRGSTPHRDYRVRQALVEQLVLNAPDLGDGTLLETAEGELVNVKKLDHVSAVTTFVELCFSGEHAVAYELLAQGSRLRAGLSKDEWVERRKDWLYQAGPAELRPAFFLAREPQQTKLWLPRPLQKAQTPSQQEVEVGWSVEMYETPLNYTLPELPEATSVYEETNRRWFWASYTVVQENGGWRIQNMADEGKKAQNLSEQALRNKIQELYSAAEKIVQKSASKEVGEGEAGESLQAVLTYGMQFAYYTDILLKKTPLDRSLYERAAVLVRTFGDFERCLTYLIPLAQRFPDQRAEYLRRIALVQCMRSDVYYEQDDDERGKRCDELAEDALHESLTIENSFDAHIALAEMLIEKNERIDEAEDHLRRASALATDPEEKAHIELHMAQIAELREQFQEALSHYQRIVELKPTSAEGWSDLGDAYKELEQLAEAERSYRRAIELVPDNSAYYQALCEVYISEKQPEKAIEVLEQALEAVPDDADLYASMASLYILLDDYRQAELFLEKAERLDPEAELVTTLRSTLPVLKAKQAADRNKLSGPTKQKKRRS